MKIITLLVLLISSSISFSQRQFFEIKKQGTKYTLENITAAMQKADWCGYFNSTSRLTLNFDDGSVVELLSGEENFDKKTELNENCFQSEIREDKGLYKIHESGILVKMLSARNTSKN
jgi:hypothetical protein